MLHRLLGPLLFGRPSHHPPELAAIGEKVGAASLLLSPDRRVSQGAAVKAMRLGNEAIELRRGLESRLARAGVHTIDPRLICEAATEMVQVVRLIARVIRCRDWLRLDAPPVEALELEAAAGRMGQLVAEAGRELAISGDWLVEADDADSIKSGAEELYNRGVARAFVGFPDPLDVLRQKTLYDALFGVVIASDKALECLREASLQ